MEPAVSFQQEVVRVLRHAPGQRMVLLTRQGDRLLTTRFFLHPVKLALGGLVEQVTVTGEGSIGGLPETLTLALEGYRVRAGLGMVPGLPAVVAAGVTADAGDVLPDPGPGLGYAYVSTEYIAGESLAQVGEQLAAGEKLALLRRLLRLIARLHGRLVVYGDLKPHNVIAVGDEPWLIDLDTMRRVPRADLAIPTRDLTPSYAAPEQADDQLTYLASDLFSFGRLGSWLLEGESPDSPAQPAIEMWRALFSRVLAETPAERPSAEQLLEAAGLSGEAKDDDPAVTVPVLDVLAPDRDGARAPSGRRPATDGTMQAWAGVFSGAPGEDVGRPTSAGDGDAETGGEAEAGAGDEGPSDNAAMVFRVLPATAGRPATVDEIDGAPADGQGRAATAQLPPRRRRTAVALSLAGASLAALATAAFFGAPLLAGDAAASGEADAAPPPPADAGPPPFLQCDERATRVMLTLLTAEQPMPPPSEILSWFSTVRPHEIEIYRFNRTDNERRYISFELSHVGFSDWHDIAGDSVGEELCTRLGHALADRGLGPPDGPHREADYEYRFLSRRSERVENVERIGDLRGIANGDAYAAMLDWLEPLEVEVSHCRARGGWLRDSALEVECTVKNPRERTTAVNIAAAMIRRDLDPVEQDRRVVLEPGETIELPFSFGEYDEQYDTYCDCSAATLR